MDMDADIFRWIDIDAGMSIYVDINAENSRPLLLDPKQEGGPKGRTATGPGYRVEAGHVPEAT